MISDTLLWEAIQDLTHPSHEDILTAARGAYFKDFSLYQDMYLDQICDRMGFLFAAMGDDAELGRRHRVLWQNFVEDSVLRDEYEIVDRARYLLQQHAEEAWRDLREMV